jgi:hypothetical protein
MFLRTVAIAAVAALGFAANASADVVSLLVPTVNESSVGITEIRIRSGSTSQEIHLAEEKPWADVEDYLKGQSLEAGQQAALEYVIPGTWDVQITEADNKTCDLKVTFSEGERWVIRDSDLTDCQ